MKFLCAYVLAALGLATAVSGNGMPEHHVHSYTLSNISISYTLGTLE